MRITKSPVVGVLFGLSLVVACHRDHSLANNVPDAPVAVVPPGGTCMPSAKSVHVKDVQSDSMPVGTPVEVDCVVVTAIDAFGGKTGDLWVEDPGGGPFSGVHVFQPAVPNFNDLKVGDLVNVTGGIKFEFPATAANTFGSVTEIEAPSGGQATVTKVGTGTAPAAAVIDLHSFASMSVDAQNTEYEMFEGVLVTFNNVTAAGPPTGFGATPFPADAFGVGIDGNFTIDSNLAAFPASVAATTCFASVTGVIDFAGGHWLILPRSTDEMPTGGTGCGGATPATVSQIQMGTVSGIVQLSGVFVTAAESSATTKTFQRVWVADSLQAAQYNGVQLFLSPFPSTTFGVGDKIDALGATEEFGTNPTNTFTELNQPTVTLKTAAAGTPVPLAVDSIATLADLTTGEPYEGVLVKISNVKVTATRTSNQVTLTDNAGATLTMDDDAFDSYSLIATANVPVVGTCFSTVIGVMNGVSSNTAASNVRTIDPRTADDMVVDATGASCN